ncbi:MAG TPA: glycosyl hydrolase family 18 protein [bacterium]|nr:glycosyl hydrolase family 18 protein [bacterium]
MKMIKFRNWAVVLLITLASGQVMGQKKAVIGYYQSWQWQKSPALLSPRHIPYDKLTVINYSFFYPLESGEIVGMDPVADRYLLTGKKEAPSPVIDTGGSLIALAKRHGTRVVLSIGGWDNSSNFPQVAADPLKRANFAHWCVKHIRQYGFDGIDVDWEFPGYVRHKGTSQDRENFTLLLQTVRDSLQTLGKRTGEHYLLSISLPAAASHLVDLEVQKISAISDYINIMTWDLFGPGGKTSNHNSALYGPSQGDSARCLDGAFKLYHVAHGVPADKINLGAAFYGHSYMQCNKIYGEHQGADTCLFREQDGIPYAQIAEKLDLFERFWDPKAQAPYLVSDSLKMLISLDDEESVALKADYVIQNKAGGLIVWPLLGDRLPDGKTPLLDAIYTRLSRK